MRRPGECFLLLRETPLGGAAVLLALLVALAAWNGERWQATRARAASEALAANGERLAFIEQGFTALERGEEPRLDPRDPGMASWRAVPLLAEQVPAFALTALGDGDVEPPVRRVEDRSEASVEEEVRNPAVLLAGRFDLAFLVAMLLPWFAILLGHRLAAAERESGRWAMLAAASGAPWRVLLARAGWILVTLWGTASLALVVTLLALGRLAPAELPRLVGWCLFTGATLAFWLGAMLVLERLERSAILNLAAASALWALLSFGVPMASQELLLGLAPVPPRAELARLARAGSYASWERRAEFLPELLARHGLAGTTLDDERRGELEPLAYALGLRRELEPALAAADEARAERDRLAGRLLFASPSLAVHEALLRLAGTSGLERSAFQDELQRRSREREAVLEGALLADRALTRADYATILGAPRVEARPLALHGLLRPTLALGAWLALLFLLGLCWPARRAEPSRSARSFSPAEVRPT